MKNRVSGFLMETEVSYITRRLHRVGNFDELMTTIADVHDCTLEHGLLHVRHCE